jgi:magnesium transporter
MTQAQASNGLDQEENILFGVTPEVLDEITKALEQKADERIRELVGPLHAADIADLIYRLDREQRVEFFHAIIPIFKPEVLIEVEDSVRQDIFKFLDIETLANAISKLPSDEAGTIIEDLQEDQQEEILKALPATKRILFEKYLTYPEKSAGRLMQREIVCVPPFWNVGEAISFIRETPGLPKRFYDLFVVDAQNHPSGKIALHTLLRYPTDTVVSTVMDAELHKIPVRADQEEVALSFDHYGLISAPVINEAGRIVGMITVDDVMDVIEEEAEEDILHMNKVSPETDFYAPIIHTAYWRIRWLLITIVNTLMASYVIAQFESSIQKITALSFLMTINAAMGGNSGMQVVTVVVRALATRYVLETDIWRAVRKEVGVGVLVGSACALILGVFAAVWQHDVALGIILALALMCNILWAAFAGALLPIIIDRLGLDPAVSAGPILTTTTDVLGYAIFLGLATLFLL